MNQIICAGLTKPKHQLNNPKLLQDTEMDTLRFRKHSYHTNAERAPTVENV